MTQPAQILESETKLAETHDNKQPIIADSKPAEETQEQINWKKFRETRERERKEKEAADKRANDREAEANALKLAMEALLNKSQPQAQVQSYGEQPEETEEQRIDRRVQESLNRNEKNREVERRKREISELPQKLQSTFSDFNQVCSQENMDYLQYHYPEVAAGYKHAPDTFETWANIYKAMKKFVPNPDSGRDQKRIEKNLAKPQSMSIPGSTQTGDHAPTELSEKRRQDNWARMQRTIKGAK